MHIEIGGAALIDADRMMALSLLVLSDPAELTQARFVRLSNSPWMPPSPESVAEHHISQLCRAALPPALEHMERTPVELRAPIAASIADRSNGTLLVAVLRAGVPGLQLDAQWTGPFLLPADVDEVDPGVYTISCRVRDPGLHRLTLTLMWETERLAFAPSLGEAPQLDAWLDRASEYARARPHVAPLCRPFVRADGAAHGADAQALLAVNVSTAERASDAAALPACPPFQSAAATAGAADDGRWRVLAPGRYRWEPYGCRLRKFTSAAARACGRRARWLVVGDSHSRFISWLTGADFVEAQGILRSLPPRGAGVRKWSPAASAVLAAIRGDAAPGRGRKARPPYTHIVFNFGQWDLELLPASTYLADWALLMGMLVGEQLRRRGASNSTDPVLVWRMTPAYSHKRERHVRSEFRTNAKLRWVHSRQLEYIRLAAATFGAQLAVHDTFAITAPRWASTVDSHHYLHPNFNGHAPVRDAHMCGADIGDVGEPSREYTVDDCPFGRAINSVGLSDLTALLNGLCDVGGDVPGAGVRGGGSSLAVS